MSAFGARRRTGYAALLLLGLCGSSVEANPFTLNVHCGASGGLNSIGAALNALKNVEVSAAFTINVSGACKENVLIQNMPQLTLNGLNGASITDASNGAGDVIDVDNSQVTISGFAISGGFDGIACYYGAQCHLIGNTIQGAADNAVFIYAISRAKIDGGALQNNVGGLAVQGDVIAGGVTVQNNSYLGVAVSRGGRLLFRNSDDGTTQSVSRNNGNFGIWVQGGNVTCAGCVSTGNQANGVFMELGATVQFAGYGHPVEVTGNVGTGVFVGDAADALFVGTVTVTGNGALAVYCNSPTSSVTHNAIAASAGSTNCTN